jgi:hypothetical protein
MQGWDAGRGVLAQGAWIRVADWEELRMRGGVRAWDVAARWRGRETLSQDIEIEWASYF